jgi:hypothetical protein
MELVPAEASTWLCLDCVFCNYTVVQACSNQLSSLKRSGRMRQRLSANSAEVTKLKGARGSKPNTAASNTAQRQRAKNNYMSAVSFTILVW